MASSTEIFTNLLASVTDYIPAVMIFVGGIIGIFVLFHFIKVGVKWIRKVK